ncbi:hypothetical protein KIN20_032599 [Parelaphostrongylus tenuis]|uniref:non-specific serine/threonine protein kinase n=1 Tax=Parelaphostrongylus tenuis TaxID=148309 RepID=A0AAD5R7D3_PARTN|nr:hypothetical protein KIN20_032599 [Parelaphostrongylus tenuis]
MGAVYKVLDKNRKNFCAAMKIEEDLWEGGVLKLEVYVLQQLQKMRGTVKLYDSGKRQNYCFMVMTLCDKDLMTLRRECGGVFSESTALRLAITTLFAIKQLHEIGYVHRDIKPGNCMIGKFGRDRKMIYLIDFDRMYRRTPEGLPAHQKLKVKRKSLARSPSSQHFLMVINEQLSERPSSAISKIA